MANDSPITIIGAGIAGLALALALARQGASVTLLEQAAEITDIGAGIQISPNGVAVLDALGLGPALRQASLTARAVHLRDGATDRAVLTLDLASHRTGRGFHLIHRADLIGLLRCAAVDAGVVICLNHKVDRVCLTGPVPVLHLGLGGTWDAPVLIGADGLNSSVRAALNGPEAPFFTHQVAWRATIPNDTGTPPQVEVHMGPGRHLVSYPLRGGTLRNIVAVEERREWAAESWSLRDDTGNLQTAFAGFSPKVRGWLAQVTAPHLWGLFRHPVAQVWQKAMPGGGVAIVGDAAHPMLPFLAQGANMALEDAWVLAQCLADRADMTQSLTAYQALTAHQSLTAYQAARKTRTSAVVAAANRNARAYHLSGPVRTAAHLALRLGGRLAPNAALKRFDWIYDHDVTAAGKNPSKNF